MKLSLHQYRTLLSAYLRPLWRQASLLLLLLLIGTGLKLLNPAILARFIDTAAAGSGSGALIQLALLFLGLALSSQLLAVAEHYVASNIGFLATNRLRADLVRHCLNLDMAFHNNRTPGEMIERVDGDVGHLSIFLSRFIVDLLGNFILLAGVFVVLFRIHLWVGTALLLFIIVMLLLVFLLRNVGVPFFEKSRQAHAEMFGFLEERLSGTEDVRANGATSYVLHRFYERARLMLRADVKAGMIGAGIYNVTMLLFTCGTILALGIGAWLFQRNLVTIGTVYLIYRYTELLTQPIEQLGRQIQELQMAGAAILRIGELLATESRLSEQGQHDLSASALRVRFDQVSFRYDDAPSKPDPQISQIVSIEEKSVESVESVDAVLRDISFSLPAGAVLGLLGRTGSGKSTLTRLLLRLYDPTQGSIYFDDQPIPHLQMAALRRRVGMVTQEIQLFHATVRQNLTLFDPNISDERILAALTELGLIDWMRSLPAGLETKLAPGGSDLSAGQAQLLALARVFLKDPGLIILDEASSRLDPASEALLERAMDRLLGGQARQTAIIIAHRLATVQRADYIMILEQGRCIEFGLRRQLLADPQSRFTQLLQTGMTEALA